MAEIKPIKRSAALSPLSREHHEGLLFAWKIRQGLQKNIDPDRISKFTKWFWDTDLQYHFQKEETILAPLLTDRADLKEQLLAEHNQIKNLLKSVEIDHSIETIKKLSDVVNDHIRFEERVLFKFIEDTVSKKTLEEIGNYLSEEKKNNAVWEDEFWLLKA
jgi:hemerythrin-like domain-containing protein